jgi:hypothetical protein
MNRIFPAIVGMMFLTLAGVAQKTGDKQDSMKDCPMHAQHQDSTAAHNHAQHDLNQRGEQGMGFPQQKTTHHFFLSTSGGVIQVTANAGDDKASVEQIRRHFQHISHAFQSGDFSIPMFVHDQTPPGVLMMTRLKDRIHYSYEEIKQGGRVVISSENSDAVQAVHDFLRFQITEHKTGDPLEVKAVPAP